MPSYVAFDEEKPKCGQIVVDRMRYKSEYSVFDIKRIIGKQFNEIIVDPLWPFKITETKEIVHLTMNTVNGREIKSSEEVSAVLLKHIKNVAEKYQNMILHDCVITIPSECSTKQKQSIKAAAEIAGWKCIRFLPEPIAAAFAYFTECNILNNSNILICDCGGGTLDICIAKVVDDQLKILSFDGDPYLGGRDFDNIFFMHFSAVLNHKFGIDVTKSNKKYELKKKCQDIKHTLSNAEEDWIDVEDFSCDITEIIHITKTEFEEMSLPLMIRMKNIIFQSIFKANIPKNAINYVFQVGGGCRMPMIKKLLADIFPDSYHQCSLYPDWVVAHGAALYAYYLQKNKIKTSVTQQNQVPRWLTKNFEIQASRDYCRLS